MRRPPLLGLPVMAVDRGSPACDAGIAPGDLVRAVDGVRISDLLDFQFRTADGARTLTVVRGGADLEIRVGFEAGEDAGLEFGEELADGIHSCVNKCVFCFIHQMPRGMRRSLYVMDDDFRLSFTHGNYVTLTNLTPEEFDRILEQRLSPLYVSVHATDPDLRGSLLGKKEPAPILPALRTLAEHRIDVHAQVVLCPGLNDGAALHQTIHELAELHPGSSGLRCGVRSVAVVPVGLTRFRERLPKLETADAAYAAAMLREVTRWGVALARRIGTRFVWLSDEWYNLAGKPVPSARHYEDFPQYEDGVGTIRSFLDVAGRVARRLPPEAAAPVTGAVITARLAAPVVSAFVDRLNAVRGVSLQTLVVTNRFFGDTINVAGLMTGQDILATLREHPGPGPVYLPSICLKDGRLFLDDVTIDGLASAAGRRVIVVDITPAALAQAVGLL
ncbi:MAG: DUF512 domain-containing protein [Armatimonadetes bacterium]|nr:DUF512 domain-containing protein [Armatimonadota bacterium]